MKSPRSDKKSEKLEVRLTHAEKTALQLEAKSDGSSVSELVRGVLKRHIDSQPYYEIALQSVQRHPRSFFAGFLAVLSGLGIAFSVIPSASTEPLTVEMLGKMESPDASVDQVSRFSARVELNQDGEGTHVLLHGDQPFYVPGAFSQPHKIEITVLESDGDQEQTLLLSMRIVEQQQGIELIAAEPSVTVTQGRMVNFDFSGDSGIRYTIATQIVDE